MGGLHFTEPSDDRSHSAARFSRVLSRCRRIAWQLAGLFLSPNQPWLPAGPLVTGVQETISSRRRPVAPRQQPFPAGPVAAASSREKERDPGNYRLQSLYSLWFKEHPPPLPIPAPKHENRPIGRFG